MKKSMLLLPALAGLLIAAACSQTAGVENGQASRVVVDVQTVQEVLLPGRAVLIDAHLTQGDQDVKDASKVEFEIWRKDSEKHEWITSTHWLDGTYRARTMFPESGVYYVKAHVEDKEGKVSTPQKELVVDEVIPSNNRVSS
ncbi:hypothetical protein SK3146_00909 [Paenibacillus konkukensis]|uniref:YtkA-like domain-containing protein n=2 Tax=Paenibacillus konkukensis TaxID=2020716 RepID=A0ABY4RHU7_9BACL|nr:hypothetical protein SK3146_00909 [Paenibacillus konkukensis]